MVDRNLLVKTKLPAFKKWLVNNTNSKIEDTKGEYECLRFKIQDTTHLIFENNRRIHLSVPSKTIYLVRQFLDNSKYINNNKKDLLTRANEKVKRINKVHKGKVREKSFFFIIILIIVVIITYLYKIS